MFRSTPALLIDRAVDSVIEKCMTPVRFAVLTGVSLSIAALGMVACHWYSDYELNHDTVAEPQDSDYQFRL